jgi:hypothetical protein
MSIRVALDRVSSIRSSVTPERISHESPLTPNFKQAIVDSDGHDTQLSEIPDIAAGLVWPGTMTRSRRNRLMFGRREPKQSQSYAQHES